MKKLNVYKDTKGMATIEWLVLIAVTLAVMLLSAAWYMQYDHIALTNNHIALTNNHIADCTAAGGVTMKTYDGAGYGNVICISTSATIDLGER